MSTKTEPNRKYVARDENNNNNNKITFPISSTNVFI